MIGYVTLGANDLKRGAEFYDELFKLFDGKRMMEADTYIAWESDRGPGIGLMKPFNGEPASVGNGVMVALIAKDPAEVDAVYNKAIELGGTCEGPAGPRGGGFYAAYFRDPDGNKLNAFCMTAPQS